MSRKGIIGIETSGAGFSEEFQMGRERENHEEKVERLTKMAESGDKNGLMEELHSMSAHERAGMAREMDALNAERRATNAKLPDIQIVTNTDSAGAERLQDIITTVPNESKAWYKPWTWLQKSEFTTDVYDPEFKRAGSGLLQQGMEAMNSRNRELNRVLAEMER